MSTILKSIESGYCGNPEKWSQFLVAWNTKRKSLGLLHKRDFIISDINSIIIKEAILNTEKRVGFSLPKSYCDFMLATNAQVPYWFFGASDDWEELPGFKIEMLSLDKIGLAKQVCPELVGYEMAADGQPKKIYSIENTSDISDPNYYLYDSSQEAEYTSCLPEMLQISIDEGNNTSALLLNSQEKTNDNELQGYILDHKIPGAYRFTSFAQMITCLYVRDILSLNNDLELGWADYHNDPYGIARLLFE